MDEVCKELDCVLVELMDCLDQLADLRRRCTEAISEGYFNLAKARYSMGPQSVGQLQYDTVMTATTLVRVETSRGAEEEGKGKNECEEVSFEVYTSKDKGNKVCTELLIPLLLEGQNSGQEEEERKVECDGGQLHRRRPQTGQSESEEEVAREGGGMVEGEPAKDPLKWFGVLVPQSLRQSQLCFIKAAVISGEVATVQTKVEQLRRQYSELLRKREELIQQ